MAELQRNFLQGIMNKDLDPHFLPDGQYRDALNIIVADSDGTFSTTDGEHNGSAQNYLGNTLMNSSLGLTNAKCIGALSYDASNLIYWLVTADEADAVFEYNESLDLTTPVLKCERDIDGKTLLNFNKQFIVTGINYINGLLLWTDNYNPPRKINIERCKNYAVNDFATVTEADINVIVQPPLSSPTIALSNDTSTTANNLENKFIYFSYRYKYLDDEYSALSPFSPVAFFPKPFSYDYGISENISMVNSNNTATISYNTGTANVKEIQLIFIDTLSTNAYVIDNINKEANGFGDNQTQTFQFQNNKVYAVLPADQVNRLFDNVPLRAKSQDLIGSRLIYGNYTQFFNLLDYAGLPINPVFTLDLISTEIVDDNPHATFKSNRDYEIGIVYLDDYGRSTTVIVPTDNTNTIHIPADKCNYTNNIQITLDKDFAPPSFATYYRFVLKQSKQEYYNIFPLTYFSDGQFKWFLINQADVDKISVGSYLYLKNSTNGDLNTQFKVLDIVSKSANFLNNTKVQPAGVYFRVKIGSNILPDVYQYTFNNITTAAAEAIISTFNVAEKTIFYGTGNSELTTTNGNAIINTAFARDVRFTIQIDSVSNAGDTYKVYAFYDNANNLISQNNSITAGSDITLSVTVSGTTYQICKINFGSSTGHIVGDYWTLMCRIGQKNVFGGYNWFAGAPYGFATGSNWNPTTNYIGDREVKAGAVLSFKMKEPNNGNTQSIQSFVSTRNYRNIEEWFFEDSIYSKWVQYNQSNSIGSQNVCFRRLRSLNLLGGTEYQGNCGGSISETTLTSCMFMYIYGSAVGSSPTMEVIFDFQQSLSPILFETVPTDTNQDIYYELTNTYPIINNSHQTNGTNQVLGTTDGIAFLNKQDSLTYPNYDFNAFAWSNGVESFRIRDDWNAATMQFSPRANSTIEGYAEQTLVQALTYSGVYQQTTAINRLNEFNLSLGNFKYLDRFFGSIQKLHARDTDLVVFQENKISKILYGKNLISDSVGGGTIASIPEVLGTQISYVGEYGISDNPESFAIWGNNLYFTDTRRGAVLQLTEAGLFEISSNGMKNWFKTHLDPSTQKLGMFDPYFEHYVLANNDEQIGYCIFSVSDDSIDFGYNSITNQYAFAITSNSEWYISVPENNWLTLNTLYGNGDSLIYFNATQNLGSSRSVIVTIKGCNGTHTVAFNQEGFIPTTTSTTTSTTTTTIAPTTTSTTTSTTTAPITYDYYLANQYLCGDCVTPSATDVLVKFISGTVVVPGRFYKELSPNNYTYEITDTGQAPGSAYTLITPSYNTCEDACASPTTTSTTTSTTTIQTVWYELTNCTTQQIAYSIGYLAGTFGINDRVTVGVSIFTITDVLTSEPGGSQLTLTDTGLTGCPSETTTSTTTSTTTAAPYDYYLATQYICGDCETPVDTNVLVKFAIGTVVIPGRFYKELSINNYTYEITDTGQAPGAAYELTTPSYLSCASSCPATTTSTTTAGPTTTSTTTIQTVWYQITNCTTLQTAISTGYTGGTFGLNDRVTVGVSIFTITDVYFSDPGGSQLTLTATGLTGCPSETTTSTTTSTTTTSTTTAAPTTTSTTTSTTTIQTVWYEVTRCSNGSIVNSVGYTVGTFILNDRVQIGSINYVVTSVLTSDPGGSQFALTATGLTGCPVITTTTTSTTTSTTTAAPTTTSTTTAAPTTTSTTTAAPTTTSTTTSTTTAAPTTTSTTTTTTAAPSCHLYTFSDDSGTGGYVLYVPCGSVIETTIYVDPFTAPQYCVADGYTPFSPDGISILGPFSACS